MPETVKSTRSNGQSESNVHVNGDGDAIVNRRIYSDPEIYERELTRIFTRVWLFVAHESEIQSNGDFVVRRMGEDQVIVSRGSDGQVRVLLNACLHRGVELLYSEAGSARSFRCPYHGWTYENTGKLLNLGPGCKELHPDLEERRANYGGLPEARVTIYNNLVFATWNKRGPSLEESLGGWGWYLDPLTRRTPAGMEVAGPPIRWTFEGNWKLPCDQLTDDNHHVATLHQGVAKLGLVDNSAAYASEVMKEDVKDYNWHIIHPELGHTRGATGLSGRLASPTMNVPDELCELYRQTLDHDQFDQMFNLAFDIVEVFPNTILTRFTFPGEPGQKSIPYVQLRQYSPLGVDRLEVQYWFLVDREAPDWFKQRCATNATRQFSPGGLFELDDAIPWSSTARTAKGVIGRQQQSHFHQLCSIPPIENWQYPGVGYASTFTEKVMVNWYQAWERLMTDPWTAPNPSER